MKYRNLSVMSAAFAAALPPAFADSAYDSYAALSNSSVLTEENYQTLDQLTARSQTGEYGRGLSGAVRRPGEVVFAYGASRPEILCQVLELTDIALQAGESINSVQIGDGARWAVQSAVSGTPAGLLQQHLIVKPFDTGLQTSLLITTDKRTYHVALKSSLEGFMPMVRFTYPEEAVMQLSREAAQKADYQARNQVAGTGVTVDDLCFAYEFTGDEELKPLRVFNDGKKTIIELPAALLRQELPALLVVSQKGGIFSSDKLAAVNYRVQGARYVLDGVPRRLRLLSGGRDGQSCDITLVEKAES